MTDIRDGDRVSYSRRGGREVRALVMTVGQGFALVSVERDGDEMGSRKERVRVDRLVLLEHNEGAAAVLEDYGADVDLELLARRTSRRER